MGGGGSKGHESFSVTPTLAPGAQPATVGAPALVGVASSTATVPAPLGAVDVPDDAVLQEDVDAVSSSVALEPGVGTAGASPSGDQADVELVPAASSPAPAPDSWGEVLTPVPTEPPVGLVTGTPLLVGGADLCDSLATLVAYQSGKSAHEVLVATVDEPAEAKLLEALALSETKMVPVEVETEVHGRLPADIEHQLCEQLQKVAISVNHHLKAGDGIPQHTHENFQKAMAAISALGPELEAQGDKEMLAHYAAAGEAIAERLTPGYDVAYDQGGKLPTVTAFETTGLVKVTHYVPAPAEEPTPGLLSAAVRDATRIKPTLSTDGTAGWDGHSRTKAKGKEYVVDLGGGFTAVYRPYAANDPASTEFSLRGVLELTAPPGTGHGPEFVSRLGQLNLVNRPMTAAEGEWAYLQRNVWAQRLDGHAQVKAAVEEADGLEDAVEHVLFAQRANEAIGMDETQLFRFAKQLRLEAEAKALPEKVRVVRDAVAKATGFVDGDALAAAPGYDPTPKTSGGWLAWERFDVTANLDSVRSAFGDKGLYHSVTGHNLLEVIRSGVLASTERRHLMGVPAGKGMSESADKLSGGARSVFLRTGKTSSGGPRLFWADPTVVLRRADWYAYNGDHYGAVNPKSHHSLNGQTRDPKVLAGFAGGSNEVMVQNGIDLLGHEAPSRIFCSSQQERKAVLALLADKGVTHLGGKPVAEVVT